MRSVILNDNHLGYIMMNPAVLEKFPTLKSLHRSPEPYKPCGTCPGGRKITAQDLGPVREALARLTEGEKAEMRRQFGADQLVALRFNPAGDIQRLVI